MKMKYSVYSLLAVLGLLACISCDSSIFSEFVILQRAPELSAFLEPGARTVVFPVMAKECSSAVTLSRFSEGMEEALRMNQRDLPVIPFEKVCLAAADSGADETFTVLLNDYLKNGAINDKAAARIAQVAAPFEPKFFLFLRVEHAEAYRDIKREHKVRLRITGKIYSLQHRKSILTFACAAYARNTSRSMLPGVSELSDYSVIEISKSLPLDPEKRLQLEQRDDW